MIGDTPNDPTYPGQAPAHTGWWQSPWIWLAGAAAGGVLAVLVWRR